MTAAVAEKLRKVKEYVSQGMAPSTACKKVGMGWPYYVKYTGKIYKKRRQAAGTLTVLPKTPDKPCMLFVGAPTELDKFAREFAQ